MPNFHLFITSSVSTGFVKKFSFSQHCFLRNHIIVRTLPRGQPENTVQQIKNRKQVKEGSKGRAIISKAKNPELVLYPG